jgi:hypothetical protein
MTFTLRDDLTRNSRKILRETIYRFGKYILKKTSLFSNYAHFQQSPSKIKI